MDVGRISILDQFVHVTSVRHVFKTKGSFICVGILHRFVEETGVKLHLYEGRMVSLGFECGFSVLLCCGSGKNWSQRDNEDHCRRRVGERSIASKGIKIAFNFPSGLCNP